MNNSLYYFRLPLTWQLTLDHTNSPNLAPIIEYNLKLHFTIRIKINKNNQIQIQIKFFLFYILGKNFLFRTEIYFLRVYVRLFGVLFYTQPI